MKARVVIPTAAGDRVTYDLAVRETGRPTGAELRMVFSTDDPPFERWLFYLLREVGAHIVTDNPACIREALGLTESEPGIIDERGLEEPLLNRHPATA